MKFEASHRQSYYKTGDGKDESDVKAAIKLLYEKILSVISLSAKGLDAIYGDTDYQIKNQEVVLMDVCGDGDGDVSEKRNDSVTLYEVNGSANFLEINGESKVSSIKNELPTTSITTGKIIIIVPR